MRARLLLLAVAAVLVAVTAVPLALAHTSVKSYSPKRDSSVSRSLRTVSVTFKAPIRSGTLRVVGPGGKTVSVGKGGRDPRKISRLLVELRGGLKAGRYRARWTAKAADGHVQKSSWGFRLR